MDIISILPLLYFTTASMLTMAALKLPKRIRLVSLGPVWLFSLLSLASAYKLPWTIGANSTFASLMVCYAPYSTKLLAVDEHGVNPEHSVRASSFIDCYRIWNNPRQLPIRLTHADKRIICNGKTRIMFTLCQIIKAAALYAFDRFIFQKSLVWAFADVAAADFAPDMELPQHLSPHDIRIRTIMSVQWIWCAYFFLEFYHSLLAVVFVAILRFDQPEDWPPLFGSLVEAYTIRGFWGRFWHGLVTPTYSCYSLIISRRLLGIQHGSRLEKTVTPMLIFTMSGLAHGLVAWALGEAAPSRDILFFEINFLAVASEILMAKRSVVIGSFLPLSGLFRKAVGAAWVFTFFFCITPLWIYPKVHDSLVGLIL